MDKFKHFMTTLGEKMSDTEVDEILQSMKKDKDNSEYLEYKGKLRQKIWHFHHIIWKMRIPWLLSN